VRCQAEHGKRHKEQPTAHWSAWQWRRSLGAAWPEPLRQGKNGVRRPARAGGNRPDRSQSESRTCFALPLKANIPNPTLLGGSHCAQHLSRDLVIRHLGSRHCRPGDERKAQPGAAQTRLPRCARWCCSMRRKNQDITRSLPGSIGDARGEGPESPGQTRSAPGRSYPRGPASASHRKALADHA
jgi:hypothetical protein